MNLLKMLATLIEEHDCTAAINVARNYITFKLKEPRNKLDSYRLSLNKMDANISRVYIRTKGNNGRPFLIPETKVLLSVDLHNPRSLQAIRDWLKTLR
jgi:hypothetical protein